MVFPDSQNLSGDPYVAMALAAQVTTRIRLGTGVTNPFTRHPAATASSIATVQVVSEGRAVLGIGRGDSSLAYLGLAPAPLRAFERYLRQLQGFLKGEDVEVDPSWGFGATRIDAGTLPLAKSAPARNEWIGRSRQTKVPVDVVASGPKVIAIGARLADRLTFAVGADPERVGWALATARRAREDSGLDPDGVSYGAYVNVVAHPDPGVARALASGGLVSFARFSAMHGTATGPVKDDDRAVMEKIAPSYDMTHHFSNEGAQRQVLTDDFSDRYGILGPKDECIDRLSSLTALGIGRLVVIGPAMGADRAAGTEARARFVEEVMPALRP